MRTVTITFNFLIIVSNLVFVKASEATTIKDPITNQDFDFIRRYDKNVFCFGSKRSDRSFGHLDNGCIKSGDCEIFLIAFKNNKPENATFYWNLYHDPKITSHRDFWRVQFGVTTDYILGQESWSMWNSLGWMFSALRFLMRTTSWKAKRLSTVIFGVLESAAILRVHVPFALFLL